ncbi:MULTISPECIES: hypothetical protein [unclassified Cryobacterium]|uniref:hypothetical protein n=1 Tax=unclassified Cryobacterium TaxID=2649013 RepID=UPI002AB521F2|nr:MULTISPECIES: hypothetical protein [unclassified Cryobacterium]MDY7541467.1 hypothetical protein [Cryobacterium sp. 5B3]MEA9999581.1 hypothetical protein [Cryobacterium sp. RTS3]MEB0265711.1 hypothetical protein [Cryobacterium sp. 10I5]MEB0274810.1 hypothetical protein [Cryobacterium sp. 5B3]
MTLWSEPDTRRHTPSVYRARLTVGVSAIALGVAATNLTSTYSLFFLALGPALQLLGWLALPGALWRRLLVILPAELAALTLLAGPDFTGAFAVLLACWLFVRHRPGISYLVLLAPVGVSFVLKLSLHNSSQNWVGDVVGSVTVIASAWVARWLAQRRWARLNPSPAGQTAGTGDTGDTGDDPSGSTRQTPSRAE